MKFTMQEANGCPIRAWLPQNEIEPEAINQLVNASRLSFVTTVCAMPDTHVGFGVPIGSVLACKGGVSPMSVGVDIGCGMAAMKVNLDPDKVIAEADKLRHSITRSVPTGFNQHKAPIMGFNVKAEGISPECLANAKIDASKVDLQTGTLGGGNHFIEICLDENRGVWVMIHSGSRNTGLKIANYYTALAKKAMSDIGLELPDPNLAYLMEGTQDFDNYWADLAWAQAYAMQNRHYILWLIMQDLDHFVGGSVIQEQVVNCHHNYAVREAGGIIVRKGAISAKAGEMGIIPGSMGAKSYIVEGLGNTDSFMSSSHGAGRKMGRKAAERAFTKEDLEKSMEGISYDKNAKIIDEIAGAYKDIDHVMENQKDLVKPVHTLKQVLSIKGSE